MCIFIPSPDGSIKIWEEGKVMLTEIQMDDSLAAGCFLNNLGDVLVGFQNQIYKIDHTKGNSYFASPSLFFYVWA